MSLAVIGGTGVYDPAWITGAESVTVSTPYGEVPMSRGAMGGHTVVFLNRHGPGHQVPPHRVNYRANLWALKQMGVDRVLATAAVGSLNVALPPGAMVLVEQFLDFTKSRATTFYEGGPPYGVVHTDMSRPYCATLGRALEGVGQELGMPVGEGAVYVATEGPRFESAAEIRAYRLLGGDVVGMTGVPEVVLARELGLCYATLSLVTNFAAGIQHTPLTHQEVLEVMARHSARLRGLLERAIPVLAGLPACPQCLPGPEPQS